MSSLLLASLLFPFAVHAADEAARGGGEAEVRTHLAQARLFAKKKWYPDARAELEAALALPAGAESYEVHRLAHDVAWALLDVPWAQQMAEGAARLAPDEDRQLEASSLADSYARQFGFLLVTGPYDGLTSRLQLELQSVVFDAELKRFISQMALELREKKPLPVRIGLPAGTYLVNGEEVQVLAGSEASLELPMKSLGAKGFAALQVFRVEVSGGLSTSFGDGARALEPAPTLQIAATQPVGPVLVGLFGDTSVQGHRGPDGILQTSGGAWGVGLRVGRELVMRAPLAVRPSALVRYGQQPGIALDCIQADGGEGASWACADSAESELRIHTTGHAIAPGLELAVDYREAGRTTAFGTGVKLSAEYALGSLPSSGTATLASDDTTTVSWTTTDTSWTAITVRALANVSFAF